MKTFISVNMSANRCGSSLLMKILKTMGASIGTCSGLANKNNPMGYFENDILIKFQVNHFTPHWGMNLENKTPDELFEVAANNKPAFDWILRAQFGNTHFAAAKSMMGILVPFAMASKEWKPKVLWARRNSVDQCRSINRYHYGKSEINPHIMDCIRGCNEWTVNMFREKKVDYREVWFERVLDNPVAEIQKIASYTGLPMLPEKVVRTVVRPEFSRSRGK